MARSCSNLVVKKGHSCRCQVRSFHHGQRSDQRRVSPSLCWKRRKLESGRHVRPCVGKSLSCWCCCVMASRNPVFIRILVACSSSQQEWAAHWTNLPCRKNIGTSLVLAQCLASLANWCGVHAAIQFISMTSTEERAHLQVSASDPCEKTVLFSVAIMAKDQTNEECLLRNIESITCASAMFCQSRSCQLMRRSCSNPVHIHHQYWRKGWHAGVSQWPLREPFSFQF